MPPKVRTLDELMAFTNSAYDPQRQAINQQIGQAGQAGQAEEQGLIAQKDKAFKDIAQLASNKKMLFSGFTPDEQANYTATKFMPAVAGLRGKVQDNIARLQSALLTLDSDQRKQVMGMQEDDNKALNAYNTEQDRRKWEQQQSEAAYQRELQKLRESAKLSQSAKVSNEPVRYTWTKNKNGGYAVVGADGKAANIDLATAVASQGGGISNLVSLLANGDAQDKKAANQYLKDVQKYGAAVAYANLVKNRGSAFYTGGGF